MPTEIERAEVISGSHNPSHGLSVLHLLEGAMYSGGTDTLLETSGVVVDMSIGLSFLTIGGLK